MHHTEFEEKGQVPGYREAFLRSSEHSLLLLRDPQHFHCQSLRRSQSQYENARKCAFVGLVGSCEPMGSSQGFPCILHSLEHLDDSANRLCLHFELLARSCFPGVAGSLAIQKNSVDCRCAKASHLVPACSPVRTVRISLTMADT